MNTCDEIHIDDSKTISIVEIILTHLSQYEIKGKERLKKIIYITWKEFLYSDVDTNNQYDAIYKDVVFFKKVCESVLENLKSQNMINTINRKNDNTIHQINRNGSQLLNKILDLDEESRKNYRLFHMKNNEGLTLKNARMDWDEWNRDGLDRYISRKYPEYFEIETS